MKILDFGVAKVAAQSSHARGTLPIGTPMYMSPEQIRGDGTIGPAADIYALGHIAYTLLAGEPYWKEELRSAGSIPVPEIRPVSDGVDFVGYFIRPAYVLPRRRVVRHLEQRLQEHEEVLAPRVVALGERVHVSGIGWISGPCRIQAMDHPAIEALRATWSSYEGHLLHADAHGLRARLLARHPFLGRLLRARAGRLRRRFAVPRAARSLAAQVQRLRAGIDGAVLLLRIGAYAECARWQDARALGLRLGLRRARARTAGLPWRKVSGLVQRGLNRGLRVAVAFEEPLPSGNVKARRLAYLFEPAPRDPPVSSNVMPPAGEEDRDG